MQRDEVQGLLRSKGVGSSSPLGEFYCNNDINYIYIHSVQQ